MDHTDTTKEVSLLPLKEHNSEQTLSEVNPKNLSMFSQGNPDPKRQPPPPTTTTTTSRATTTSHLFAGSKLTDELELKKLQVFVRVRPSSTKAAPSSSSQQQIEEEVCVHAASTHALAIAPPEGSQAYKAGDRGQTYAFSRVFDAETTQQEYYESTARPLVTDLLCNRQHNSVVMAYGITAAGKTYTIEGTKTQPGVMPRALKDLFSGLDDNNSNAAQEDIRVKVSLCEVYNEQIFDLLLSEGGGGGGDGTMSARGGGGEHQRPALKLKEDAAGRVIVAGLKEVVVHNVDEALMVLRRGSKQRQRAGTGLNYASSRSHSIFTVTLYQPVYDKKKGKGKKVEVGDNNEEEEVEKVDDDDKNNNNNNNHQVVIEEQRLGRIAFVDLAGSERAQRTGNVGVRLKESVAINSSLMTLGRCLEALRWNQKCQKEGNGGNAPHLKVVPYRESKVTHLFRDALHGWGRVILSVNVSPVAADYDETSHVLKYAALATQIGTLQTGEAPRRGFRVHKTPMVLKRKGGGGNDDEGDEKKKSKKMKVERQGSVPLTGQSQNITDILSQQQQQQVEKVVEVEEKEEEEEDAYVQHDVSRQVSVEVEEEEEEEEEEVSQQGQGRVVDQREEESVSFTLNRRSLSAVSEPGGEFCPITSTTPPLIVHNNDDIVGGDGNGGGVDAAIHQATTTTPQSNAVTPVVVAAVGGGNGDGDLEFVDEEDVAALQARVQQLIGQLQAAEEKCVLIESEVRAEVAEEMSALLRDMEANYKERLMMSNNGGGGGGGNSRGGGGMPMSQVKAAAAVVEDEECDDDDASGSEGSPSSSPPSSATTTDNDEEEGSNNDDPEEEEEEYEMYMKLKLDLSNAKERISELESQLEQLIECNTTLQKELEEANNDGTRLYEEYQALQKQLEEAKENVTQVEANTTMEQELIENQLDREKKNNAMLQERLNAAMGALTAIGSPSTTIMQKLAAAHGNNNNGSGGGFRNGNGGNNMNGGNSGMEPGHTPHDIALMRARRAAAAEEEQHQQLQQQLLNSAGPPSTGGGGGGHSSSMPPLSLPPPGTACGNKPSRFASQQQQQQQPQQQAGDGNDDDVPLSLLPPSILKSNDDDNGKDEKEEEREEEADLGDDDDVEEEEEEKVTSEQNLKRRSSNRRRRTITTTTTTTISSIIEALDAAAATTSSPPSHDDHVDDDDDDEKEEAEIKEVVEEEEAGTGKKEASPLSSPAIIMHDDVDDNDDDMECSPCQDKVEEEEEEAGIAVSSDAEGMEVEEEGMSPIIGQPEEYKEEEEEEEESEGSFDEDDSEEEEEEEESESEEEEEWAPSDEEDEEEEKEIDDLVPTGIMKKKNPRSRVKKRNSGSGGGVEMKHAGDRKRSKDKGGTRGDTLEEAFNDAAAAVGEKEEEEDDDAVVVQTEHMMEKKTTKRRLLNNPNSARMRNVLGDWNSMEEEGEDCIGGGVRAVSAEASAQVAIANLRRSGRARR